MQTQKVALKGLKSNDFKSFSPRTLIKTLVHQCKHKKWEFQPSYINAIAKCLLERAKPNINILKPAQPKDKYSQTRPNQHSSSISTQTWRSYMHFINDFNRRSVFRWCKTYMRLGMSERKARNECKACVCVLSYTFFKWTSFFYFYLF